MRDCMMIGTNRLHTTCKISQTFGDYGVLLYSHSDARSAIKAAFHDTDNLARILADSPTSCRCRGIRPLLAGRASHECNGEQSKQHTSLTGAR